MRLATCAVLALAMSACGNEIVLCPAGYYAVGKECHEIASEQQPDVKDTTDAKKDTTPTDTTIVDSFTPKDGQDTEEAAEDVDLDATDDAVDTGPDLKQDVKELPPTGTMAVGSACIDDFDCLPGLSCFNWPKGYCTITNCDAPGTYCPGSSVCWGQTEFTQSCAQGCDTDADCRKGDGYGCKRMTQDFGGIEASMCLPGGSSPLGFACEKALDCAGSSTCLTDIPGGYCARVGCGVDDPCDAGSACVLRNGKPMCLKSCAVDGDCQIPSKDPRSCVAKTDLGKKAVKVCLDTAKASPVGGPCLADLDCESKLCSIFAKGTCAIGGTSCLNDAQCGAAGPCKLAAAAEKGICGAPCSGDKPCPSGGVCVPASGSNYNGSCQPNCQGPGDAASCGGVPDLECLYGQPIPPPGTPAMLGYACAPRPKSTAGAPCTASSDCLSKNCFANKQGTAGYCAATCGGAVACPFGTICVDIGVSLCLRTCSVDFDCPSLMTCQSSASASSKFCMNP